MRKHSFKFSTLLLTGAGILVAASAQAGGSSGVSVPDNGTTFSLLALAFVGVVAVRRKLKIG